MQKVVTLTSVTGCKVMFALSFHTFLLKCVMKKQGRSAQWQIMGTILGRCLFESVLTIWCSSLLENDRFTSSIFSNVHKF